MNASGVAGGRQYVAQPFGCAYIPYFAGSLPTRADAISFGT